MSANLSINDILATTPHPEAAAQALVTYWVNQGVAFTSGHVVSMIREARPDFVFSQARIGGFLRTLYGQGQMPQYQDEVSGAPINPVQYARLTERTDTRTPVGTEVFVYAPSLGVAQEFDFEINVLQAPDSVTGISPAATMLQAVTPTLPATGVPVVTTGRLAPNGEVVAVVHSDGRLCVPRSMLELMALETGVPIAGGSTLYMELTPGKVLISQEVNPTAIPVSPTKDKLRLHIRLPANGPAIGTKFPCKVAPVTGNLTIDLSNPL